MSWKGFWTSSRQTGNNPVRKPTSAVNFRMARHPSTINSGLPSCPLKGHNVCVRHPLPLGFSLSAESFSVSTHTGMCIICDS
jgi:hypothetical protein